MIVLLPILITSPGNGAQGRWRAAASKRKAQRRTVDWALRGAVLPSLPVVVTLTRIATRSLDDDNLAGAFKSIRDAVADRLGCGDSAKDPIQWAYAQRKGAPSEYAIEIKIEAWREEK